MYWLSPSLPGLLLVAAYFFLADSERRIACHKFISQAKSRTIRIILGTLLLAMLYTYSYKFGRTSGVDYNFITRMSDAPAFIICMAALTMYAFDIFLFDHNTARTIYYGVLVTILSWIAQTTYLTVDNESLDLRYWRLAPESYAIRQLTDVSPKILDLGDFDKSKRSMNMILKFTDGHQVNTEGLISPLRLPEFHQAIKSQRPDLFQEKTLN